MSILMYKQRFRPPNYNKTPKCNYAHIRYIATRPGASKNEGMRHGLFGKLVPGNLVEFESWQEVAKEVRELSYKKVNIFRSVISFAPQTAEELGLNDHKSWEEYIERHIGVLAQKNGISQKNLAWACAHHNEASHPHIHIVFWDKNQKTMKNFVKPQIADSIRIQLIKETFSERIEAYLAKKDQHKNDLKVITDELVKEFDDYMKTIYPKEYKRLKEMVGDIDADELSGIPINQLLEGINISTLSIRLFQLKEKMPKKGRLYYQLLPDEVKQEVDRLIVDLKKDIPHIQALVDEYAEIKANLAMLYDTDPENITKHREQAVSEMDKLIANKLLSVVKGILNKEYESNRYEFNEGRRAFYTEQMVCEILMMLEQNVSDIDSEYEDRNKAMGTELSKRARKELYLRNKDKGMEK
ncbi:hypothetical protein DesLBE_3669 [Desulfitobacterium sp. LBE]|uniref:MobP3 family relaxase n=1 Tax=Desulfitobacterium sp. LBE TaxID=884086 RepID=UPI00119BFD4D|nr:MobP3 family relaxase [Desulfitobacterium sp. LBE]TWH59294.1 hypothetical protein DesLBE_3669 [Desulfitobacterium sp. LBE]